MVVLAFDSENGADQGRQKLIELNNQYVLDLVDAVEVVRGADGKIKVKSIRNLTGVGAMGGAFWGLIFGLLFFVPLFGVAVGAVSGAIAGHFSHVGLNKDFLKGVEDSVKPGTSALAIIAANVTVDKVVQALTTLHPKVIRSSLSTEQEAKLNEAFGAHTK
jgi:uncharacterized membrane protein